MTADDRSTFSGVCTMYKNSCCLVIAVTFGSARAFAAGSVVFDNTLPNQAHGAPTTVPLVGGHYTIDSANTGYLRGSNLFESFATFIVASGEQADFTNSINSPISNVISRVTGVGAPAGLQPTTIDGKVVSTIAGANFWFINPAGVTIGSGAQINVPAGLAIGTTDFIQFADNSRFYALPGNGPTPAVFSTASPAAFGFLPTPATGALTVQSPALNSAAGGSLLLASGGPLTVGSTTTPVSMSTGPVGVSTPGTSGTVTLQSPSSVTLANADVQSGGVITITSGPAGVTLTHSAVTSTNGSGVAGSTSSSTLGIEAAGGPVVLQSSNLTTTNVPFNNSQSPSAPANISISGDSIAVHGGSIGSQSHNGTDAGNVTLAAAGSSATAIQTDGGAAIASQTSSIPPELNNGGSVSGAGAISLQAPAGGISINGGSIVTRAGSNSGNAAPDGGQPGPISLTAQQISITNNANLSIWNNSGTTADQVSPQGVSYTATVTPAPISLTAPVSVAIVGSTLQGTSLSYLPVGDIDITSGAVSLQGTTLSTVRGYYSAQSGDINITASAAHGIADGQEAIVIEQGSSLLANGASGSGNGGGGLGGYAGNIDVSAPNGAARIANSTLSAKNNGGTTSGKGYVSVSTGSTLTVDTSSILSTTGEGGNAAPDAITLHSGGPMLINAATISDVSPNAGGIVYGTGGNVLISAPSLIINGGSIETTTGGGGAGGSVLITASGASGVGSDQGGTGDAVLIKGGALIESDARLFSCCTLGAAGNIEIDAPAGSIQIQKATVSTNAQFGQAGVIGLSSATGVTLDGANLSSKVLAGGDTTLSPADITVKSSGAIDITGGSSINSSTNGATPAGTITITTPAALLVSGSSSVTSATGAGEDGPFGMTADGSGQAGSVALSGGSIHITGAATIDVSTTGPGSANTVSLMATGRDAATGAALLVDGSAVIESNASGGTSASNAGLVKLAAPAGTVQVGMASDAAASSLSTAVDSSSGAAGAVTISGAAIDLENANVSTSTASTNPSSTRGTITLTAAGGSGSVTVKNSNLNAATSGVQQAGDIEVSGTSVNVNGGQLTASTTGTGNAGNILLSASGTSGPGNTAALLVSGAASVNSDASGGASPDANAGYVKLTAAAGTVQVGLSTDTAQSLLSSQAGSAAGSAGTVTITGAGITLGKAKLSTTAAGMVPSNTRGTILLDAGGGSLSIADSNLDAATSGVQQAGEIDLRGGTISISNSTLSSATTGTGPAGAICVTTTDGCTTSGTTQGRGRSAAKAESRATASGGGTINIAGSTLSTSTSTSGNAGDISVITPGALTLSGSSIESQSTSTAANAGAVGVINLTGGSVGILSGSAVSAQSSGGVPGAVGGPPAAITITATDGVTPLLLDGSTVSTKAAVVNGSNIVVNAGGAPILMRGSLLTASATGGNGGNITINDAGNTALARGVIVAQAGPGNGGAINIRLEQGAVFVQDSQSLISATSQTGNNGTVSINSPQTDLNSALRVPEVSAARSPELAASACRHDETHSTFVREGRGGVTPGPGDYLLKSPGSQDATVAKLALNSSGGCN